MIPGRDNWGPITVPADKFFALGDNRDDSADSRFWGFLDRNDIRGKAWRIYWSADGLSNIRREQDRESRRVREQLGKIGKDWGREGKRF